MVYFFKHKVAIHNSPVFSSEIRFTCSKEFFPPRKLCSSIREP